MILWKKLQGSSGIMIPIGVHLKNKKNINTEHKQTPQQGQK